jgi:hypothetical protein
MNRRDIMKGLCALPFAVATQGYGDDREIADKRAGAGKGPAPKIQSVQILLEGAFTVVLDHKTRQATAFVPKANSGLSHRIYFNDPSRELPGDSYQFTLSQAGLREYQSPYINGDFKDFEAETDVWKKGKDQIKIVLPFPESINFSGRPLDVVFKHQNRPGRMPTSHILEYFTDPEPGPSGHGRPQLSCPDMKGKCEPSPYCPPGTIRYFFGAAPDLREMEKEKKKTHDCDLEVQHAKDFFNNVILPQFPALQERLTLSSIDKGPHCQGDYDKRGSVDYEQQVAPAFLNAVYHANSAQPHLLPVASLIDCQVTGPIVHLKAG